MANNRLAYLSKEVLSLFPAPTLITRDTVPQAVHLPTGSSLSRNTNLEPCKDGKEKWKNKRNFKQNLLNFTCPALMGIYIGLPKP